MSPLSWRNASAVVLVGAAAVACALPSGSYPPGAAPIFAGAALAAQVAKPQGCGEGRSCASFEQCVKGACCTTCGAQCCKADMLCFDDGLGAKQCVAKCDSSADCPTAGTCCGAIDSLGQCASEGTRWACIPEDTACTSVGGLRSSKNRACR